MRSNSYKDLKIFQNSLALFYKVHAPTLRLPKYEFYSLGDQLRRSADSTVTNLVEGYGRRRYKADYIRFLIYAQASSLETGHHLEKFQSLYSEFEIDTKSLIQSYDHLGASIYQYIRYVQNYWLTKHIEA